MARSGVIKGITIEFDANTTKLGKALDGFDSDTKKVNKELSLTRGLLKFNPGNAEIVAQKQTLLAKNIQITSDRLSMLKTVQSQVDAQFASGDLGEEEYRAFQREVVATEGRLKHYQNELKNSKTEQTQLSQNTKQLDAFFKASGKTVDDYADVLGPSLTAAMKEGRASSTQLETAINKIGKTSTESREDFDKFKTALKSIDDGGSIDGLRDELKQLSAQSDETGDALGSIGGKLDASNLMQATDALSGISDKAAEMSQDMIGTATSIEDFKTKAARSLGLSADATQEFGDVVEDVMKNGVVSDVEDAGEAVITAKNYFGDLDKVELSNVSNKIATLSSTFGLDFNETARSAKKLMDEFGLSSTDAFDLMTAGLQQGLNNSDDFLDTINEYSSLIDSAGFSAQEFGDVLSRGMQNGAMNTDKVADAVKEFQIRLGDGTFEQNIGSFSDSTKNMFEDWKTGKATVKDVMDSVGNDLKQMDPSQQQAALSALSSQFEDLGTKASVSLFSTNDGLKQVGGAADSLEQKSPGEKLSASLNTLKTSVSEAIQPIVEGLAGLVDKFNSLPGPVQQFAGVATIVGGVILGLIPVIVSLAVAVTSLDVAIAPIIAIILAVIAVIALIVVAIMNWGAIVDWLKNVWNGISGFFSNLWSGIKNTFNNALNGIKSTVQNIWNGIKSTTQSVWNGIKNAIMTPINAAKNAVAKVIDAIKGFFNFHLRWPHIPMPHFGISPRGWRVGDLLKGSIPRLGINWYAKGGVFNKPTLFQHGNQISGVGEAGPEAVLPLNKRVLAAIGAGIAATMKPSEGPSQVTNVNQTINYPAIAPTSISTNKRLDVAAMPQL